MLLTTLSGPSVRRRKSRGLSVRTQLSTSWPRLQSGSWQDVLHPPEVTVQPLRLPTALHVDTSTGGMEVIEATAGRVLIRHTHLPPRGIQARARSLLVGAAAGRTRRASRVGPVQAHQFITALLRYAPSHRFGKMLRSGLLYRTCAMFFCAMRGMTEREQPRTSTMRLRQRGFRSGSAKRMLP